MKRPLKRALSLLYPLCFALAPLLSLYGINRAEVSAQELVRPLLVVLVSSGLALGVLFILSRRVLERATLGLSLLLFGFFSYGVLERELSLRYQDIFGFFAPSLLEQPLHVRALSLGGVFISVLLALVLWGRYNPARTTLPAWVMGAGYLGPALYSLLQPQPLVALPQVTVLPAGAQTDPKTPDLYCILLDAYGRQDQLKALYGLDNTPFLNALEQRGFKVLRQSRANYLQTPLCVASFLNLDYLPPDPRSTGLVQEALWINNNRLSALLRGRGYQIVDIPSDFPPTALEKADIRLTDIGPVASERTPFERLLLASTPFAHTLDDDHPAYDEHRSHVLANLRHIAEAARIPGPKFVFAHVMAPHPPFVLGQQAEAVYPEGMKYSLSDASAFGRLPLKLNQKQNQDTYRTGYSNQLLGVNKKVLETLDALLENSQRPAVIVLLGDHGSRKETDWASLERTNLSEALSNFQAVRVPGGAPYLTDDLTPINTFRLLMTHIYGEVLPRLPDRSYYSPAEHPLDLTEVTNKLK